MKSAKINSLASNDSQKFNDNGLLLEPLYLNQNNYYYPFVFAIKTKKALNGVYLDLLEGLMTDLYLQEKERIFEEECDLKFYKMIKFAANVFFFINNLKRPSPNTLIQYKLNERIYEFYAPSTIEHPFLNEFIVLVCD